MELYCHRGWMLTVHAADESKVVVQGLDSYIVAEKNGQLLVCSLKEEQRIKEFGE